MALNESMGKRRLIVIINHLFLILALLFGIIGSSSGWTSSILVAFWVSAAIVLITFYPLHVQTGLWRLAHTPVHRMDERELQQTLGALRHAYILFTIVTLLVILTVILFELGESTLLLVVFWILLYLAHTLPSSVLAWSIAYVPTQSEEG
jgi:hypothetical protein